MKGFTCYSAWDLALDRRPSRTQSTHVNALYRRINLDIRLGSRLGADWDFVSRFKVRLDACHHSARRAGLRAHNCSQPKAVLQFQPDDD